jgi:site-specific DNA recombinase
MTVAIYARVSSDSQEARGTIGSQLDALRQKMVGLGHQVVHEYTDDGYSGTRLDRPGLDALRDAAEAGLFEQVWCLTPDRLARSYAYQILITDELARHGVGIHYLDAPPVRDNPEATLLVQVQGVIAEYERAKIAERNRRGKLFRARAGEIVYRLVPYGYRRIPRGPVGPAHLQIYDPEAVVVQRIFDDFVAGGYSMRRICRRLYEDGIPSPSGRPVWSIVCISGMLGNPTYKGRARYNRHQALPPTTGRKNTRLKLRPHEECIEIPVPAIISEDLFEAAQRVATPVLVSNVSSLPEIVGDAAVLVSQTDVAGIAHGLGQLITDEEVRRELRERGLERAGQYAWAAVARRVLDAIARSEAEKQRSLCPLGAARSDRVMDSSALDPAAALSRPTRIPGG